MSQRSDVLEGPHYCGIAERIRWQVLIERATSAMTFCCRGSDWITWLSSAEPGISFEARSGSKTTTQGTEPIVLASSCGPVRGDRSIGEVVINAVAHNGLVTAYAVIELAESARRPCTDAHGLAFNGGFWIVALPRGCRVFVSNQGKLNDYAGAENIVAYRGGCSCGHGH